MTPVEAALSQQQRELQRQRWVVASEVLYFSRPVVTVVLGRQRKNRWRNLAISIIVELLALWCWFQAERLRKSKRPLTPAEALERRRRKLLYLLYLLRAPLWDTAVKPTTDSVHSVFANVPLLGSVATYFHSQLNYYPRHHFYTSGSSGEY